MKKNLFAYLLMFLVCAGGMTLLNSCLKTNNTPAKPAGVVSVLQAAPGAPAMNLFFNTNNLGSLSYGGYGATPPQTVGNYTISFVNASTGDTVSQVHDSIGAAYYSLILYDTTSPAKAMFFQDQYPQPQSQTDTYVRFLHLSPGTGAVNVFMDSTELFQGRTFADNLTNTDFSRFSTYSQGYHSFVVLNAANNDTLGKIANLPLRAGYAYTVFLQGTSKSSNDSLSVKLNAMPNYQIFQ